VFQDFDVVYYVTDVEPFKNNLAWIDRFGELMILQMPELMADPPPEDNGCFVYLMQFADGNRIDLTLAPVAELRQAELDQDSLSVSLLDKDGILPSFPPPSESGYLPTPPTAKAFADCCNEFWWLGSYIVKGLWREEILYAKHIFDQISRPQLMKMLTWYVGVHTQFLGNPGKFGKHLKRYLEPELWALLERTYAGIGYDETWEALFAMCDLFRVTAVEVAAHLDLDYPHGDDERVSAHLRHVHSLPRDAAEMY
jgi:aminoglycoside 6-adenylyltransferase